jgi:predicted restriction endonuclease
MSEPRISYPCYKKRFGGWTNACIKFIEYKMGADILADDFVITNDEMSGNKKIEYKGEISRDVPLGLRLKILSRDNFRCIFCGKSPATDFGTKLHIDHVVPFSKGGKSILENLQTLCEECNLGKSNRNI